MFTVGVVAEYNPFHNGHKYQLEQARKMGATHIVCVMSGTAVQRGDIAVYSKYERANSALENGADLVIELPCPYSCSGAEIFAESAVYILASLGENVVNGISFGCENDDIRMIEKASEMSAELKDSETVRKFLSQGMSYPLALKSASDEQWGKKASEFFDKPNNVLGAEYVKWTKKLAPWIKPMPVKRNGAEHHSNTAYGNSASASFIRKCLKNGDDISEFVPYSYKGGLSFIENSDSARLFKYMTSSEEDILNLPDCNEFLAKRFLKAVESSPVSAQDFAEKIKCRNITMARVRRLLLHLVLGVTKNDFFPVPYGRILGLDSKGGEILSKAEKRTIPFDTSLKRLEKTSDNAKRISFLEQNAVRLQDFCRNGKYDFHNEYTVKIQMKDK